MKNLLNNPTFTRRLECALRRRNNENSHSNAVLNEFHKMTDEQKLAALFETFNRMQSAMSLLLLIGSDPIELLEAWVEGMERDHTKGPASPTPQSPEPNP